MGRPVMTKEEMIELAKQAGFVDYELDDGTTNAFDKRYETFARLVAEKEREACATIVDEVIDFWVKAGYPECAEVRESMNIYELIRARKQE